MFRCDWCHVDAPDGLLTLALADGSEAQICARCAVRREHQEDRSAPAVEGLPDLLITDIRQLVTVASGGAPCKTGAAARELGIIEDAAVLVEHGRIAYAGPAAELPAHEARLVLSALGGVVLPGFVDSHTHLVWAGSRAREFALRCTGVPYAEIARAGGGIKATVRDTRAASFEALVAGLRRRVARALAHGATTIEVKSGYGLDRETELRLLEAIAAVDADGPADLVPTYLGAHEVPPEFAGDGDAYLDFALHEVLPEVAHRGLARFADVYCERGVFTPAQAERFLWAARAFGLRPTIHAEQLSHTGGALVAAGLEAVSAAHLEYLDEPGCAALAEAGVIAQLLPGAAYVLGQDFPDARRFLARGIPVALATDCNPGSSPTSNLPLILHMACVRMHLHPAEAIVAATLHGAAALGLADDRGSIEVGKRADFVLCELPDWEHFFASFGVNPVARVIKDGRVAV